MLFCWARSTAPSPALLRTRHSLADADVVLDADPGSAGIADGGQGGRLGAGGVDYRDSRRVRDDGRGRRSQQVKMAMHSLICENRPSAAQQLAVG